MYYIRRKRPLDSAACTNSAETKIGYGWRKHLLGSMTCKDYSVSYGGRKPVSLEALVLASVLLAIVCFGIILLCVYSYGQKDVLQDLAAYSNADHGDNLTDFIKNVRNEEHEYLAVFVGEDWKLLEHTDFDATKVKMPALAVGAINELQDKIIYIHNHPKDVPFSTSDLSNLGGFGGDVNIVVTPSYTYCLEASRSSWPTTQEVERYLESLHDRYAFTLLFEEVDDCPGHDYVSSKDFLVQLFAYEFGLKYTVLPAETSLEIG